MTDTQWKELVEIIGGKEPVPPPVGFIIDSPWLPGWSGCEPIDYYSSDQVYMKANLRAVKQFPDAMFLPGFWSEYGEINEPSAFGSKMVWVADNLPHAETIISEASEALKVTKPNVRTDGLLPLMINRMKQVEEEMNREGHKHRFAVARGPFNIATFLMGATEFMISLVMNPAEMHALLRVISDYTIDWLRYQKECFPGIDGIMILDDLVGFVGEVECAEFAVPYLNEIFHSFDCRVRFFHNDADGLVVAAHLEEIDVNIFNFSFKHSMQEMRDACGESVVLMGNIPPRDVLASGNEEEVRAAVKNAMQSIDDHRRILWSVGGGVPQGVSSENMQAFISAVRSYPS